MRDGGRNVWCTVVGVKINIKLGKIIYASECRGKCAVSRNFPIVRPPIIRSCLQITSRDRYIVPNWNIYFGLVVYFSIESVIMRVDRL